MKKFVAIILALGLVFSLCACSSSEEKEFKQAVVEYFNSVFSDEDDMGLEVFWGTNNPISDKKMLVVQFELPTTGMEAGALATGDWSDWNNLVELCRSWTEEAVLEADSYSVDCDVMLNVVDSLDHEAVKISCVSGKINYNSKDTLPGSAQLDKEPEVKTTNNEALKEYIEEYVESTYCYGPDEVVEFMSKNPKENWEAIGVDGCPDKDTIEEALYSCDSIDWDAWAVRVLQYKGGDVEDLEAVGFTYDQAVFAVHYLGD